MEITFFELEEKDGSVVEWVKIDRGNDEFTWMPKAIWDEQQKAAELGGTL